jgi:GTPase SAR1 family protein
VDQQVVDSMFGQVRPLGRPTLRIPADAGSQVVVGPPGSGKTTYCAGIKQFLNACGRETVVINLDPANDAVPYACDIDISELVSLAEVMAQMELGPNGSMVYCMEYLERNLDWLREKLEPHTDKYFVIDCPGQVELYTHHESVKNILHQMEKWGHRLAVVHLVDSYYCSDPAMFVSALLVTLSVMVRQLLNPACALAEIMYSSCLLLAPLCVYRVCVFVRSVHLCVRTTLCVAIARVRGCVVLYLPISADFGCQ